MSSPKHAIVFTVLALSSFTVTEGLWSQQKNQDPSEDSTRLYLSRSRLTLSLPEKPAETTVNCQSQTEWSATLKGDMVGSVFTLSLPVQMQATSFGDGEVGVDIVLKRNYKETVVASARFTVTGEYQVKTAEVTGSEQTTVDGDLVVVRTYHIKSAPCIMFRKDSVDKVFIEIPRAPIEE